MPRRDQGSWAALRSAGVGQGGCAITSPDHATLSYAGWPPPDARRGGAGGAGGAADHRTAQLTILTEAYTDRHVAGD